MHEAGPKKDWLGDQLRELYGDYAEEPLPTELEKLLAQLDDDTTDDERAGS